MNQIATNVVRLMRKPGLFLVVAAAVPVAIFVVLGFLVGRQAETGGGWTLFVVALVFALPVVVLAVRRERLRRRTDDLDQLGAVLPGTVVVSDGAAPRRSGLEDAVGTFQEAVAESRIRSARWFPRVEATQRGLVRAAGGVANAPYLRDDLRVTLLAFLGTVAAIPLGVLGTFMAAFTLLLG